MFTSIVTPLLLLLLVTHAQPSLLPQPHPSSFPLPYARGGQRLAGPYLPAVFHCVIDSHRQVVTNWIDHPSFHRLDLVGLFVAHPRLVEVGILCGPSFAPEPRLDAWRSPDSHGNHYASAAASNPSRISRYQPFTTVFQRVLFDYATALDAWRQQNATIATARAYLPLIPLVDVQPQLA